MSDDCAKLRSALLALHDDIAEYARINHLGGYENHAMRQAREALAGTEPKPTKQSIPDNNGQA